ncbi:MAG: outer membrane lipoprotein carrier protein LolA [Bdellovibrionales bacterium]|nr:outer membrane lipoprotein carrier protein LolA [Bdellovibrionales bacterium]NQZ18616.1 outer membrane lipoprotein carrier protein LolA [Bdellovibrionales bacterium]
MFKKPLFISLLLISSLAFAKDKKTIVRSVSVTQMKFLRAVDSKYQKQHGIHIKLKKVIKLGMLGSTKESTGEAWLEKGKMRLEIQKPEASKIIAGPKYLWIETPAPEDFKDSKTQVLRASLKSDRAKSQGLIQLLTGGGVLKYFKVSGIQSDKDSITYYLQPDKQSLEFKRAQIVVETNKKLIKELRYWDQMDNETTYSFLETSFDQKLPKKLFNYVPPKDAEVITY